jgi:hypothetical protein
VLVQELELDVHPAPVEVRADRPFKVIDERVYLGIGGTLDLHRRPASAAHAERPHDVVIFMGVA